MVCLYEQLQPTTLRTMRHRSRFRRRRPKRHQAISTTIFRLNDICTCIYDFDIADLAHNTSSAPRGRMVTIYSRTCPATHMKCMPWTYGLSAVCWKYYFPSGWVSHRIGCEKGFRSSICLDTTAAFFLLLPHSLSLSSPYLISRFGIFASHLP
ncbi:hypothetical protein BJY00DRAFT_286213 [Aspergillus carlsbadensis]|nr:hypothetical protein BJY00DRAFT_286213 [Aspergillus carlsbadensis]